MSAAAINQQQKHAVFKPPRSDLRKLRELTLKRARKELYWVPNYNKQSTTVLWNLGHT